jgi:hypothetical protein
MERVNAMSGALPDPDIKIADFWETTYLPHLKRNAKPSTLHGYKKIWDGHLFAAFAGTNLRDYHTHHATLFLTHTLPQRGGLL